MSRRFIEWQQAVFTDGVDVLIAVAYESMPIDELSSVQTLNRTGRAYVPSRLARESAAALQLLIDLPGVHVAIISHRPLTDLAWGCHELPRVWLVADSGQSARDPHGRQLMVHSASGPIYPRRHGLRNVLERLPRQTAMLLGADERVHLPAIAVTHARSLGLALHVPARDRDEHATVAFGDGAVHGRLAWIELLHRLHVALVTRSPRWIGRSAYGRDRGREVAN